jgi:hypothetical protein
MLGTVEGSAATEHRTLPLFGLSSPCTTTSTTFELSVMFDPESDPSSRLVSGVPSARYGQGIEDYGKDLPPEAFLDVPYCPFKMDVFQFGVPCKAMFSVSRIYYSPALLYRADCADSCSPGHDIDT